MRRFVLGAFIITLLIIVFLSSTIFAMAEFHPFNPGSRFFAIQRFAEHNARLFRLDKTDRAEYTLKLLQHRVEDLINLIGTENEIVALLELNRVIDLAAQDVAAASPENYADLRKDLFDLVNQAGGSINLLKSVPEEYPDYGEQTYAKLLTLWRLLNDATSTQADLAALIGQTVGISTAPEPVAIGQIEDDTQGPFGTIMPRNVPFQPDSPAAQHAFFPLDGTHATLVCEDCHSSEQYAGTPNTCTGCHTVDRPIGHFEGECSLCHSTSAWKPATFNHNTVDTANCASCHNSDKPINHYDGQCSACHSTNGWRPATFNHNAVDTSNCASCHNRSKPANHYEGQCSACHSTNGWRPATFNHNAVDTSNCASCHNRSKPANHYEGQCSACHSTNGWRPASFNHSLVDTSNCAGCHNRPTNHYDGQCSACHSTNGWRPASFNHSLVDTSNCAGCHNRPANHFSGQCSACHSTNGWRPASFNHSLVDTTNCAGCHNRPNNHFSGQCSSCHNTSSWGDANFSHSFPINHRNANGDCSACHPSGTNSWTCYTCHDRARMEEEHRDEGIANLASRCTACHPDGRKHDD